jgi:hypothetical protein
MHANQVWNSGQQLGLTQFRGLSETGGGEAHGTTTTRATSGRQMVLLAPASAYVPESFHSLEVDPRTHRSLLARAQRLRAQSYLQDGAIEPWQISDDGRFEQDGDQQSWHLLILDSAGEVAGCARYRPHRNDAQFTALSVSHSALANTQDWGPKLRWAIQSDLNQARKRGIGYVECGGWALAEEIRCSTEAVRMALSMYALARKFGGVLGVTTATTRHHSSAILRRLGGHSLKVGNLDMPPYFDPQYDCEMEILRFDSSAPEPRFEPRIQAYEQELSVTPIVQSRPMEAPWRQWSDMPADFGNRHPAGELRL